MFDISFFELAVIGAVALVVIGPERLPQVARTVGRWIGKIQRYVSDVKADINREMEFEELRRLRAEMNETARSVEATARSMERTLREQAGSAEDAANELAAAVRSSPAAPHQPQDGAGAAIEPAAEPQPASVSGSPAVHDTEMPPAPPAPPAPREPVPAAPAQSQPSQAATSHSSSTP